MSMVTECLTRGGIPDGWTQQNLVWLAETHRRLAKEYQASRIARTDWHLRWAALIEDVLETRYGQS